MHDAEGAYENLVRTDSGAGTRLKTHLIGNVIGIPESLDGEWQIVGPDPVTLIAEIDCDGRVYDHRVGCVRDLSKKQGLELSLICKPAIKLLLIDAPA